MTRKRSYLRTVETSINAVKQFHCIIRCINCRGTIMWDDSFKSSSKDSILITCKMCSTTFLADTSRLSNQCSVMLSENNQWFSANTAVMQHIFEWQTPQKQPTENELLQVLRSKYSMRLNVEKKIIESATLITPEKDQAELEIEEGIAEKISKPEVHDDNEDELLEFHDKVKVD